MQRFMQRAREVHAVNQYESVHNFLKVFISMTVVGSIRLWPTTDSLGA